MAEDGFQLGLAPGYFPPHARAAFIVGLEAAHVPGKTGGDGPKLPPVFLHGEKDLGFLVGLGHKAAKGFQQVGIGQKSPAPQAGYNVEAGQAPEAPVLGQIKRAVLIAGRGEGRELRPGEHPEMPARVRGHGHDAALFHGPDLGPVAEDVGTHHKAALVFAQRPAHVREGLRFAGQQVRHGHARRIAGFQPAGDSEHHGFVPVSAQGRQGVQAVVQIAVVKGHEHGLFRQWLAVDEKTLGLGQADSPPAGFRHGAAMLLETGGGYGDGPRTVVDVMVHGHGETFSCGKLHTVLP